jgi:hypothetical protein
MALSDEFRVSNRRALRKRKLTPAAVGARYDRKSGRVQVKLGSGIELTFSPENVEGLEHATADQLGKIEISPSGFGLYFPKLDIDIYLPALLEGVLGSKKWMAARLGAAGGIKTSVAKKRAARSNGKLGGRPKKPLG